MPTAALVQSRPEREIQNQPLHRASPPPAGVFPPPGGGRVRELGHPIGATGAMLLGTALDELARRDKETALITMCIGGGMGIATIIERV